MNYLAVFWTYCGSISFYCTMIVRLDNFVTQMFEQIKQCAEDFIAVIDKEANTRKSFELHE